MISIPLQETSVEIWQKKYQLKDLKGNAVDRNLFGTYRRIARALARVEKEPVRGEWEERFFQCMVDGATPGGRIVSNAGAEEFKPKTSLINCTVSNIVKDSMDSIMDSCKESALTLKAGCGIGYEFSTLRPKGAHVSGAGAYTSGPLPFMDIFDKMCFTVSSAGGRRGAQMATFAVWHPDVEDFIRAKREDGRLRQFNMSLLIDDDFVDRVINDDDWELVFPIKKSELDKVESGEIEVTLKKMFWDAEYCDSMDYVYSDNHITCRVYKRVKARYLWDIIMQSTYDYAEPGFLLIDRINELNNNYWRERIRATNPCGEQPLPPHGSCLLGSVNVTRFVINPFSDSPLFDWEKFRSVVATFTRMLDNVVDMNGLPLKEQREEISLTRRHGMGVLGLGSAMTMMNMTYGSEESIEFTENVMREMAVQGFKTGTELAIEKGPAPLFEDQNNRRMWVNGKYMSKIWEEWPEGYSIALEHGCRFSHHTSVAPTGTISLSINNNASGGIEPSFAHQYTRNVIKEGKKTKDAMLVFSYEMLAYKHITGSDVVPEWFSTTDNVTPRNHIDVQAAAQKWCDSSISKTVNVPTSLPYKDFSDIYLYAYEKGLKGCTTFRFNPDAFQGVLVKEEDLGNTEYVFTLEDGSDVVVTGNTLIEYDGQTHTAANLFDAIKEGYYGKF